jgi:hypothetical protein
MTDTKISALEIDTAVPAGTYVTYVRPHQLKRTDLYTEGVGKSIRRVVIESVASGEITYRGRPVHVLFVIGRDLFSQKPVIYTKTSWEFMEVQRIGDAPQYRSAVKVLDQYVY